MRTKANLAGALLVAVSFATQAQAKIASEDFRAAAEEAYIYGLGIVAMYRYYSGMAFGEGALNGLVHSRSFMKPGEKPGSGPNVDTYYSYGWFDLGSEPYVVSLPAFEGRYYVCQLTDMYGHNFHNVGNDLFPPGPVDFKGPYTFLLAPPDWEGEAPEGMDLVRATGKLVNVLYRIRVTDEATEAPLVHALQDATLTMPLSAWQAGRRESVNAAPTQPLAAMQDVIYFGVDATGARQRNPLFFQQLSQVLQYNPPSNPAEREYAATMLQKIGFDADFGFDVEQLSMEQRRGLLDGQEAGYDAVQAFIPDRGTKVGSAVFTSDWAGNYGEDWRLRSAMVLAGAMYPTVEVSRYADIFSDAKGDPLTGDKVYTMTFRPGELPPVTSFWSLTIYSLGSYDIVANPIDRYKIGPETPGLIYNMDGSFTITLAHEELQPAQGAANWLPTPAGRFYAMVRFYAPTEPVLKLTYRLPEIAPAKARQPGVGATS